MKYLALLLLLPAIAGAQYIYHPGSYALGKSTNEFGRDCVLVQWQVSDTDTTPTSVRCYSAVDGWSMVSPSLASDGFYPPSIEGDFNNDGVSDLVFNTEASGPYLHVGTYTEPDIGSFPAPEITNCPPLQVLGWTDSGAPAFRVISEVVSGTGTTWVAELTREAATCNGTVCLMDISNRASGGFRNLRVVNLSSDLGETGAIGEICAYNSSSGSSW